MFVGSEGPRHVAKRGHRRPAMRYDGRAMHQRRGQAPKRPTLLDPLGVRGRLEQSKLRSAHFRRSRARACSKLHRHVSFGGGTMSKRNQVVFEEGSVEALARLQKQDEEFCRRLRVAIETGRESCPTTVFTEPCTNRPVFNYMRPD